MCRKSTSHSSFGGSECKPYSYTPLPHPRGVEITDRGWKLFFVLLFGGMFVINFLPYTHSDAWVPMSEPQPGDGVWIITAKHGVITEVPAEWEDLLGTAKGHHAIDQRWIAIPTNEPDTAIITGNEKP